MLKNNRTLALAVFAAFLPLAFADQGSFTNSGGSMSISSGAFINSTVASPAGSLSMSCPGTGPASCAGGSFRFVSNDGVTTISATFTKGTFGETCSGGGKGGHTTCTYTFTGYISGNLTINGASQAIIGVTSQLSGTSTPVQGKTAYNSAYTPFYYSDSEQILCSDDLQGTNQISFGAQGSGAGQFYGAYGIALDASGRIYVADTYNCRVVRIDDMSGANWTSYGGACGSGQGQFYDPYGIAVDSNGEIYILDTGNTRLVRMDDMNGTNWTALGSVGGGVGQFAGGPTSVAVDANGSIYVADTGNRRIVRMDDITGANWTVLTQSPPIGGVSYSFQSPRAVSVDNSGRIYVADDRASAPAVIRVDDMTGANWTSLSVAPTGSSGVNSIAVDGSGTVYTGGGGAKLIVNMGAVLNSSGSVGPIGSYYVFGVTPVPVSSPPPSAIGFAPATLTFSQAVGTTSAPQSMVISNFGGAPLNLAGISVSGDFAETDNCPSQLAAGANCTVSVTFSPSVTGADNGQLTVGDDSGNLGESQSLTLTGVGTGG